MSAGRDDIAILWSSETGEEIRRFEGHEGAINDAAFSPDGSLLITAADDETARIWAVSTGQLAAVLAQAEDIAADALAAAFSPTDLQEVAVSYENGTVVIWDFVDLREGPHFHRSHSRASTSMMLATAPTATASFRRLKTSRSSFGTPLTAAQPENLKSTKGQSTAPHFSPDGEHILSSSAGRFPAPSGT